MPIIGSSPNKSFSRSDGTRTGSEIFQEQKAVAIKIRADLMDTVTEDMADAISSCLFKDGSNFNADIDINGQKFTDVGTATARTHFASAGQVADSSLTYAGTSSGTDTITASVTPAITAYAAGQRFHFKAGGTNTGAATININSVGAKDIKKGSAGSTALVAGDITSGGMYTVEYDGTNFVLLNPGVGSNISAFAATILDDADASAVRTTIGVAIGSDVQAYDADLDTLAGLAKTDGNFIVGNGTNWVAESGATARASLGAILSDAVFPGALIAIIQDQKNSGTHAGDFTSGADRTRALTTLVYNRNTTVTLSSNQFTLPAGSWEIEWSAPAYKVEGHQSMLYDVTGTAVVGRGTSEISDDAQTDPPQTRSVGSARVTPSGSNVYEIRHRCTSTQNSNGLGVAASFGTEIYTRVVIRAA